MLSPLRNERTRLIVALLLVPALALRVLVPPGFMPGTGADDAPTMQMCHGAGPLPAPASPLPAGQDPAPDQGKHHESPCVFAAAGSTAPPPTAAVPLGTASATEVGPATPLLVFVPRSVHRAQAARAPPAGPPLA
jgi:hypothetical protein